MKGVFLMLLCDWFKVLNTNELHCSNCSLKLKQKNTALWLVTCHINPLYYSWSYAYLLFKIKERHGLHRDDGLGIPPSQVERIKKDLCSIFSEHSLKITTKNIVNFLNVTLDLTNGKYVPYTKANIPLYLHKRSNHPPRSTDNISQSFNNRLSGISYHEDHSSKPYLSIKKPLMTPDINTDSTFQPNLQR